MSLSLSKYFDSKLKTCKLKNNKNRSSRYIVLEIYETHFYSQMMFGLWSGSRFSARWSSDCCEMNYCEKSISKNNNKVYIKKFVAHDSLRSSLKANQSKKD